MWLEKLKASFLLDNEIDEICARLYQGLHTDHTFAVKNRLLFKKMQVFYIINLTFEATNLRIHPQ